MKNKKPLYITLLALDAILTLGLSVFNIIMLANVVGKDIQDIVAQGGLFAYLAQNATNVYLPAFVVPLFLLLAGNIILLVWYVRKSTRKEPVKVEDLSDEQKEALRKELLEELGQTDEK
ncbi:MAG: hypothetical protein IJS37_02625 [Bacilli bacterium]|nr:hypothetical protein [Bacilli bacterium]